MKRNVSVPASKRKQLAMTTVQTPTRSPGNSDVITVQTPTRSPGNSDVSSVQGDAVFTRVLPVTRPATLDGLIQILLSVFRMHPFISMGCC